MEDRAAEKIERGQRGDLHAAEKPVSEFFGKCAATIGTPPLAAVAGTASAAEPPPSPPPMPASAAAQRGYRHWLVIGVGAAVLVLIFLANR